MVIQPLALVAAQGTCVQDQCCDARTVCYACKCCEVETDGGTCSCCSSKPAEASSCCASKADKPQHDALPVEQSGITPKPSKTGDEDSVQHVAAVSSCMCGIRAEPIAPAPCRAPSPQVRELVVIAYLDHLNSGAGRSSRCDQQDSRLPIGDQSPHFSQRFLCIWRI